MTTGGTAMSMRPPTTRPVVVSGSDDATVRVWDLDARGLLYDPLEAHKGKVNAVAVGKLRGRPIAVSGGNDRTVRVWDLLTGRPLGAPLVGHDRRVLAVAVGELGGRPITVSGGNDNTVRVWDLDTGALLCAPFVHDGNVLAVAVGELGGRAVAVSASDDFTVRVWDLEAGEPLGGPLEGHHDIVKAVAVGELGGRAIAVSGGCDKLVRVWDLAAGGPLGGPLAGHEDWVNAVAVGEAGGRPIAVSGGIDDTVRVWDLAAGRLLGAPLVHDRIVNAVAVGELQTRSLAASWDADETVRPVLATTLPAPGREDQTTRVSGRVDEGGSAGSGGTAHRASRRRDRRAAPAGGLGAVTRKSRSWHVNPLTHVVLIALLVGGIFFFGVGVKGLVDSKRFLAKASSANGVVVDVARVVERVQRGSGKHPHYENVPFYHPVVQFVTPREQVVRFQASEGNEKRSAYQVGASIRILYDPANPRDARLDTWVSRLGDSIIAGCLGLFFVVLVAVIYSVMLRSSRRAARRVAPQNRHSQGSERRADG